MTAVVVSQSEAVSEEQIIAALRPMLAAYKLPKQVFCVRELPRNAMGKVQKNLLREQFAAKA